MVIVHKGRCFHQVIEKSLIVAHQVFTQLSSEIQYVVRR